MTISSNDRRKEYAGNGATTVFNGPRAFHASDVQVYLVETATGAASLVSTGDYTLTGLGRAATRITMNVAPASGYTLLVLRTVPFNQPTDITNQGSFLPEIHEDSFDRQVMQIQQLGEQRARTLRIADTSVGVDPIDQATPGRFITTTPSGFGVSDVPPLGDLSLRGDLSSSASGAGLIAFDANSTVRQRLERVGVSVDGAPYFASSGALTPAERVAAIHSAQDEALARGVPLVFGPFEYEVDSALLFKSGTHWMCAGIDQTVFKLDDSAPLGTNGIQPVTYDGSVENVVFEGGFTVDGNYARIPVGTFGQD